jgi:hypothetical protein
MSTLCRVNVTVVAVFIYVVRTAVAADSTLQMVTENVLSSERLYQDVDVEFREEYSLFGDPVEMSVGNKRFAQVSAESSDIRYVSQRGKFRITYKQNKQAAGIGGNLNMVSTRMFDGDITRLFMTEQNGKPGIANEIAGRENDLKVVRPHMFLLRDAMLALPLSTYMEGDNAVKSFGLKETPSNLKVEVEYKGAAEFDGLNCHIVWISHVTRNSGEANDRWVLWLAEDRNFIPVHRESFTFRFSKTIPIGNGTVSSWQEVGKGVWFPSEVRLERFDSLKVQSDGAQVLTGVHKFHSRVLTLEPDYEPSYFQDIEIPDKSAVYRVTDGVLSNFKCKFGR